MHRVQTTRVGAYIGSIGVAAAAALASAAISTRANDTTRTDNKPPASRSAMIDVLGVAGPNRALGEEAQTFDRLVGTWDAEFTFSRQDGTSSRRKGELHFGWVMDGYAIQDLWIGYPAGSQKERTIGTTLRFFDPKLKQWLQSMAIA